MEHFSFFRFYNEFPLLVNVLVAVCFLAVLFFSYKNLDGVISRGKIILLAGIKALVFICLLMFLLNPTIGFVHKMFEKPSVAVLIDSSKSMTIKDGPEAQERIEQLKKYITDSGIAKNALDEDFEYDLRFFTFDDQIRSIEAPEIERIKPEGMFSRLDTALKVSAQTIKDKNPAGIVVLSDGRADSEYDVETVVDRLGIPVYPVVFGKDEEVSSYKNVGIVSVDRPKFSEIDKTLPVKVVIKNTGYNNEQVKVLLKEDDKLVKSESVLLTSGKNRITLAMDYLAKSVGPKKLSVEIEGPVEEDMADNTRKFQVYVTDINNRVILVCGKLKWDFAFLSRVLKRDKAIRFESAVRVNEGTWLANGRLTRGGFFKSRENLFKSAVVILMDVERKAFSQTELKNLVDFVDEKGGGLCMLGRSMAFGAGDYAKSPLDKALPVVLEKKSESQFVSKPFNPVIPDDALKHPVLWSSKKDQGTKGTWSKLARLAGYTKVGKARQGAQVLMETKKGNEADPLLLVQRFGRGRTMVFAGYESWQWAMKASGEKSSKAYAKFWSQAVRWLMQTKREEGSGEKNRFIYANKDHFLVDDNVVVRLKGVGDGTEPAFEGSLEMPDGSTQKLIFRKRDADSDVYEGSFICKQKGTYAVKASPGDGEDLVLDLEVYPSNVEMDNIFANSALLKRIAERTGGSLLKTDSEESLFEKIKGKKIEKTQIREQNLTQNWIFFILAILLMTLEWVLRKIYRLS